MHLNYKISFIFIIIFLSQKSFALITIIDPQNLISQTTQKLGSNSFEQLYAKGQKAIFNQYIESCEISCTDDTSPSPNSPNISSCSSTCKEFTQDRIDEVLSVENNTAAVLSSLGDYYERTQQDVLKCEGNLSEIYLENLDNIFNFNGTLYLLKMTQFKLEILDHEAKRTIEVFSLWGSFQMNGMKSAKFPVKISVAANIPGAAQIVMFSVMDRVWFKLKGIQ